tara:strand:- start:521 stop:1381 length:861 start_codon:yes stop_codon:yes gene_type:complete
MKKSEVIKFTDNSEKGSPLVFDNPHSGRCYPLDFKYECSFDDLRRAEDAYLDKLYDWVPAKGFSYVRALFPRSYIDVNRSTKKMDNKSGTGLIRSYCSATVREQIYKSKPTLKDVFNRISKYYKPYHDALSDILSHTQKQHGGYVYINCHSMPSDLGGAGQNKYDIILGTNNGRRCDPLLLKQLKILFEERGYNVGVHIPHFQGGHLVYKYGAPEENKHAILVEVNRKLYLNEDDLTLHAGHKKLKSDLQDIYAEFDRYARLYIRARPIFQLHEKRSASSRIPRRK